MKKKRLSQNKKAGKILPMKPAKVNQEPVSTIHLTILIMRSRKTTLHLAGWTKNKLLGELTSICQ